MQTALSGFTRKINWAQSELELFYTNRLAPFCKDLATDIAFFKFPDIKSRIS